MRDNEEHLYTLMFGFSYLQNAPFLIARIALFASIYASIVFSI